MSLRFDHTHYVPVLRFKRSEKVALRELDSTGRRGMTPLIEIVQTADYSPRTVADELRTHWGPTPFFLDLHHLREASDGKLMLEMNGALRSHGLKVIPVISLGDGHEFRRSVQMVAALENRGVCLRLFPEDLRAPLLHVQVERLVKDLDLHPEDVDLIVDYRIVSLFNPPYEKLTRRLPMIDRWRTFTVVSGAFSQDLSKYEKNRQHTRDREDWLSWLTQVKYQNSSRLPTYGDYTI